jgi:hypothetical protein
MADVPVTRILIHGGTVPLHPSLSAWTRTELSDPVVHCIHYAPNMGTQNNSFLVTNNE